MPFWKKTPHLRSCVWRITQWPLWHGKWVEVSRWLSRGTPAQWTRDHCNSWLQQGVTDVICPELTAWSSLLLFMPQRMSSRWSSVLLELEEFLSSAHVLPRDYHDSRIMTPSSICISSCSRSPCPTAPPAPLTAKVTDSLELILWRRQPLYGLHEERSSTIPTLQDRLVTAYRM